MYAVLAKVEIEINVAHAMRTPFEG